MRRCLLGPGLSTGVFWEFPQVGKANVCKASQLPQAAFVPVVAIPCLLLLSGRGGRKLSCELLVM